MNQRDIERAIEAEVEEWPGVKIEFTQGKSKHPKAKFTYLGQMLALPYAGSPSNTNVIHITLGQVRRTLRKLGAERPKPEPSRDEDEAPYRKPNDGADKRPPAVAGEKATPKATIAEQLVSAGAAAPSPAKIVDGELEVTGTMTTTFVNREALETLVDDGKAQYRQAILDAAAAIVNGVYFGLPAEVYHAVPRLSAGGLQRLCVSPGTFWKDSWLNPEREEQDEEATKAEILGRAYHCARLEPDVFHDLYVRKPCKDDFPADGLLTSDAAVKAALKDMGEQQTVTGETIEERCGRLVEAGYEGTIWPLVLAIWEREDAPGRTPIDAKHFDQIVQDMERIRDNGDIAELLTGGAAEVSVFWTDSHGLKCKCRFDYLTEVHWVSFKTFDNSSRKALEQAIVDAVRYNRYHVGEAHYRDGAEAIRTGGLDIVGEATEAERALIAGLRMYADELACWFVFQEKNGVPNLLARQFAFYDVPDSIERTWDTGASEEAKARGHEATSRSTQLFTRARWEIDEAKRTFVLYSQAYDPGHPWFPLNAKARLDEFLFNHYWLEGKV